MKVSAHVAWKEYYVTWFTLKTFWHKIFTPLDMVDSVVITLEALLLWKIPNL